jgi:hypothetical protein
MVFRDAGDLTAESGRKTAAKPLISAAKVTLSGAQVRHFRAMGCVCGFRQFPEVLRFSCEFPCGGDATVKDHATGCAMCISLCGDEVFCCAGDLSSDFGPKTADFGSKTGALGRARVRQIFAVWRFDRRVENSVRA